jgi:molybdopterin synthase catalytic subunit
VRVRLFAALRELAGASEVDVDDPDGGTVDAVLHQLSVRYGARFDRVMASGSVVVNGEPVGRDHIVRRDDEVALLPPVSGGGPRPDRGT